jgi:4'-phosphopantetheinyl transferase
MDGIAPGVRPGNGEVRAATAWLDRAESPIRDAELLSAAERSRAARFHFDRDRDRFVVGRAALRRLLGEYLGQRPARVEIESGRLGKPRLAGPAARSGLRFNVAHSGGLALYAFTYGREVGVDVEALRPIPDARTIARNYFSPLELSVLSDLPETALKSAFLNAWTRKEAFLKARGDGLYFPLDRFHVSLAPGEPARLLGVDGEPAAARQWSIQALDVGPGFVAAVAARGPIDRVVFERRPYTREV